MGKFFGHLYLGSFELNCQFWTLFNLMVGIKKFWDKTLLTSILFNHLMIQNIINIYYYIICWSTSESFFFKKKFNFQMIN